MVARARAFALGLAASALVCSASPPSAGADPVRIGGLDTHGPLFKSSLPAGLTPDSLIPQGRVASGMGLHAWFANGTGRYQHAVLGDSTEAETLVVDRAGARFSVTLPEHAVFEDLEPRIVDIDRDGQPEILAIKAYLAAGATVALYGLRQDALIPLAEAAPIGRPNRWLNPIGVADFDGDGTNEIAVIRTPHIGGVVIHYRWESTRLIEERRIQGYSNHRIGATALGLSAIVDWDRDGVPDHLIPRQDRSVLAVLSARGGAFRELAHFNHEAEIVSDIKPTNPKSSDPDSFVYMLQNTEIWRLSRP